MHWKALLLLPVSIATFMAPQPYSITSTILAGSEETDAVSYNIEAEDVNPGVVGGTGEEQVSNIIIPAVLYPELIPVCSCESTGSPFNEPIQFNADGSVVRGHIHPPDTGMCQINANVWQTTAEGLGYDIETKEGNILMANFIYDKHGLAPWSASKSCWDKALL